MQSTPVAQIRILDKFCFIFSLNKKTPRQMLRCFTKLLQFSAYSALSGAGAALGFGLRWLFRLGPPLPRP